MSMLRDRFIVVSAILGLLASAQAHAACGDDVGGSRVACGCGEVVVSDTRLQASDPVVSERCRTDGLIVRAKPGADSITLDLGGNTILGSGHGTGLRVLDGGAQGATIVGGDGAPGEVTGFGSGFRARGQRSVRELRNVNFTGNVRDGVVLRGAGTTVSAVTADRNGRDGLRVGGRETLLEGVAAQNNAGDGLRLTTRGARLENSVSAGNAGVQTRASRRAGSAGAPR